MGQHVRERERVNLLMVKMRQQHGTCTLEDGTQTVPCHRKGRVTTGKYAAHISERRTEALQSLAAQTQAMAIVDQAARRGRELVRMFRVGALDRLGGSFRVQTESTK